MVLSESVTRSCVGFKSPETADRCVRAWQNYYNYLRPHQGLNGLTPAEMAGVHLGLNGGNRWLQLLKKANGGVFI